MGVPVELASWEYQSKGYLSDDSIPQWDQKAASQEHLDEMGCTMERCVMGPGCTNVKGCGRPLDVNGGGSAESLRCELNVLRSDAARLIR